MVNKISICLAFSLAINALPSFAAPFEECPSKAFLIQKPDSITKTFGVDLVTGSYSTLAENMQAQTSFNAVGFNDHDEYLYGWDHATSSLARVGNDYLLQAITINKDVQSKSAGNFVAGDVSSIDNIWYGYRKDKGLFKVYLEGQNINQMEYIEGSAERALHNLTDLAFHPTDGFIYAVTNGTSSKLLRIDAETGEITELGTIYEGVKATFGAQFFDASGALYASNNNNGYVYKIDIDNVSITTDVFAYGPKSSLNDGARCANAPVEISEAIDFGDAPASYGSAFEDNGARHSLSSDLRLGSLVSTSNADDGIQMPTGFESGNQSIITSEVSGLSGQPAYLNGWVDWDQDGAFEADEQAINNLNVSNNNNIVVDVPAWASEGETWARFRLSTTENIGPTGGVSDGEVEDYQVTVTQAGVTLNYYPSSASYTTFAYEDLYPKMGDYDMNDVVMQMQYIEHIQNNQVIKLQIKGRLTAIGASYHNGFAIQLKGVDTTDIRENSIIWKINNESQTTSPLKTTQQAIIEFTDDLNNYAPLQTGCLYFRTELNCTNTNMTTWEIDIPFANPIDENNMPEFPYDPFIFATPGLYHGDEANNLLGKKPGHSLEIHLKNQAPTELFDTAFYGYSDDVSNPSDNVYFVSENGMGWAIEVPYNWKHPLAGKRLDDAYPEFTQFAADRTGKSKPAWYLNVNTSNVYED
ncbi:LruC domain-containing protein [Algibacillus agarilyticus]|uniref:LruC domain-containing protein n=1 Tax=Algibacillus agarilyticus TaxID=2234133 RepID=UPI000DCF7D90|nr:LruC domain-containing protein [Algibacillus agarilyticus]